MYSFNWSYQGKFHRMKYSKIFLIIATAVALIMLVFFLTKNETKSPHNNGESLVETKEESLAESNSSDSKEDKITDSSIVEKNKEPAEPIPTEVLYTETNLINGTSYLMDILAEGYDDEGMWFRKVRNEQGRVYTIRREENPIHKQAEYGYDLDMNAPEYVTLNTEQLELAAFNDDEVAQLILTHRAYKEGNETEGRAYLLNSAAGGMTRGLTLAAMVQSEKQPVSALALLLVAQQRGDISINTLTKRLTEKLTPEQQVSAKAQAESFMDELRTLRYEKYGTPFGA